MVLIARLLLGLQILVVMAAIGAGVAFFGAIGLGLLFGASNMEGGLAMGAAGLMPIGGLVGAGLGLWMAWRLIRKLPPRATMLAGFGMAVLIAAAVAAWFIYDELSDGNPYRIGYEPDVHIEWRLPEMVPYGEVDRTYRFMARSSYQNWILSDSWDIPRVRDEGGVSILRMKVQIRWRVTGRTFQLWRASNPNQRITVDSGLPRDPDNQADYGPWQEIAGHPGHAFRTRVKKRQQ